MITAGDIRKGVIFDDGSSTDPKNPNLFLVVDFPASACESQNLVLFFYVLAFLS